MNAVIYLAAAVTSLILSFWISSQALIVNPDAICYLLSADVIGKSGVYEGMHLCPQAAWPFYSWIISTLSTASHFSLLYSAYLIDGLFTLLSVLMFIAIVQQLGGSRRVLWLAAAIILFSHEFISVRQYIIRDHGFWAFYLTSMFFMIRYVQQTSWFNALAWGAALCLATLFRIEGAIFFVVLPFSAFFLDKSFGQRVASFLKLYTPILILGLLLLGWLALHPEQSIDSMGRLAEIGSRSSLAISKIIARFDNVKISLMQYALPHEAAHDAGLVLFLTMVMWYGVIAIQNLSWMAALLVLIAWIYRVAPFSRTAKVAVWAYLLTNLVITAGFFAENVFLSKRYLIAQTLVLLLWVPFVLDYWLAKIPLNPFFSRAPVFEKGRLGGIFLLIATMAFLFIPSLGVLFQAGTDKSEIRAAGTWLAEHVSPAATLYSNNYQLLYYSQHFGYQVYSIWGEYRKTNPIASNQWKHYDYLAFRMGRKKGTLIDNQLQKLGLRPTQVFQNKSGDRVVIVKVGENKQ